jgi:hypothetical protein
MNELQTGQYLEVSNKACARLRVPDRKNPRAIFKHAFTVIKKSLIHRSFRNRINCAAIPRS